MTSDSKKFDPHELHIVNITDLSRGGSGVARLQTGEVVFVPFTAPGDRVRVQINEKKKNFLKATLVEIIEASPVRVIAPCPVFQKCGGCDWQHLPYSLQFETKKKGLRQALERAKIQSPKHIDEMPAKTHYHYRNRIQLRGNQSNHQVGYHEVRTNRIVPIESCEIARPEINTALSTIKLNASNDSQSSEYKVEIEVSDEGNIQYAFNQKHAAFGFRQINSEQNETLKDWVKKAALDSIGVNKNIVLVDAFGGHGNLSIPLSPYFKEIHCVDLNTPKIDPSHKPSQYHFHRSAVTPWFNDFRFKNGNHEKVQMVAIFDPPREGLGHDIAEIIGALSKYSIQGIILVGCDADSFARDVSQFTQNGFTLDRLGVLDLFPQTIHVESLALLVPSA